MPSDNSRTSVRLPVHVAGDRAKETKIGAYAEMKILPGTFVRIKEYLRTNPLSANAICLRRGLEGSVRVRILTKHKGNGNPWSLGEELDKRLIAQGGEDPAVLASFVGIERLIPVLEARNEHRWEKNVHALRSVAEQLKRDPTTFDFPCVGMRVSPTGTVYCDHFWLHLGLIVQGIVSFPDGDVLVSDHLWQAMDSDERRPAVQIYTGDEAVPPPGMLMVGNIVRAGQLRRSCLPHNDWK